MKRLKEAMLLLIANDGPLAPEWRDHPLKGGYSTAVQARKCGLSGAGIGRRLSPTRVFSFGTAPAS